MPDHHRLDVSVSFTEQIPNEPGAARTFRFGLYNAYWRQKSFYVLLVLFCLLFYIVGMAIPYVVL